jgi:hypothetical protein
MPREKGAGLMSKKDKTYEQAEAMQAKAARFLRDVVGDEDKANEIEGLSVEEYADRKGLRLMNPAPDRTKSQTRSKKTMAANSDPRTKDQILESEQMLLSLLDDIWNEGVIANDKDEIDAEEAVDVISDLLNEFDADRFPVEEEDEDEIEGQEEEEAAA